jgi:hypothetical protein
VFRALAAAASAASTAAAASAAAAFATPATGTSAAAANGCFHGAGLHHDPDTIAESELAAIFLKVNNYRSIT